MVTVNYRQLKADASATVSGFGRKAIKLIAIHAGLSVGANLMLSILSYVLDLGIAQTGGLSGIGTRALLETVQQFLQTAVTIVLPFWEMGYVFSALQLARGQNADSVNLLTGFRHLGAVLRTHILQWIIYFVLAMVGAQIACYVFMLTPAAKDMIAVMEEILSSAESAETLDYETLLSSEAYLQAMLPAVPFMVIGALIPMIPVLYRMRMMHFALMDDPQKGAFHALGKSLRATRKQCLAIFKLDLHFWWYYLLQLLTVALCSGDILLPLVGLEMDWNADAAMFLFYALALICEFGLYVWKKNQVTATYVLLYDQLCQPREPVVKPAPTRVPWNYEAKRPME